MAHRLRAAAGIVGPLTFVMISLVGGWIQPGYSLFSDYVSALSLGPRGWAQIASFVMVGASLLLLAATGAREFTERGIPLGGPTTLAIIGAGYLLSGPLVMDPPGTPPTAMSWHGLAHGTLGGLVFALMPISCFVFLRQFKSYSEWQHLCRPTLVLGCAVTTADIVFIAVTKIPSLASISTSEGGLLQRLVIVPFMCWVALFGTMVGKGGMARGIAR